VLSYIRYVFPFTVVGSRGSLICRLIAAFTGTLVAFTGGFTLIANGTVVDGAVPVVNCVVCAATALPATSFTPDIVSVICVDAGSAACGVMCTNWFPLPKVIVELFPATAVAPAILTDVVIACVLPAAVNWIVVSLTVVGSIVPLNSTLMFAFTGTFVT
jgi:hypothetical protein